MSEKIKKLIKPVLAVLTIAGVLIAAYFSGSDVSTDKGSDDVRTEVASVTSTVTSVPAALPEAVTTGLETSVTAVSSDAASAPTSGKELMPVTETAAATLPPPPETTVISETKRITETTLESLTEKQTGSPVKAETCILSISCTSVFDNLDKLRAGVTDVIPKDGIIFPKTEMPIREGETVYDLISETCRENGIPFESSKIAMTTNRYIEGIANLYEFDAGNLSGWMYSVNGKFPQLSTSQVTVRNGDVIEVVYSCNIGVDVGDDYFQKAG